MPLLYARSANSAEIICHPVKQNVGCHNFMFLISLIAKLRASELSLIAKQIRFVVN